MALAHMMTDHEHAKDDMESVVSLALSQLQTAVARDDDRARDGLRLYAGVVHEILYSLVARGGPTVWPLWARVVETFPTQWLLLLTSGTGGVVPLRMALQGLLNHATLVITPAVAGAVLESIRGLVDVGLFRCPPGERRSQKTLPARTTGLTVRRATSGPRCSAASRPPTSPATRCATSPRWVSACACGGRRTCSARSSCASADASPPSTSPAPSTSTCSPDRGLATNQRPALCILRAYGTMHHDDQVLRPGTTL